MAERTFDVGGLYIDHEPDHSNEIDADGKPVRVELPGFVDIGVVINGVKVPLTRRKAGSLLPQLDAAKQKQAEAAAAQPPAPPEQ